jgi:hypothetical protein
VPPLKADNKVNVVEVLRHAEESSVDQCYFLCSAGYRQTEVRSLKIDMTQQKVYADFFLLFWRASSSGILECQKSSGENIVKSNNACLFRRQISISVENHFVEKKSGKKSCESVAHPYK